MSWSGYSEDFEDAYERRFSDRVKSEKVFNEWVKEYNRWINEGGKGRHKEFKASASKYQQKALAYEAQKAGIKNTSIEGKVKYMRGTTEETKTRVVYRNLVTYTDENGKIHYAGSFAKNPYKEMEG